MNRDFTKTYDAEGAITKYRIVKFGAADYGVLQATTTTEKLVGISRDLTVETGDRIDVVREGVTKLTLGGTVTRGDRITSDADGKGVTAAPGAGVNAETVGIAEISGVAGDEIDVYILPTRIQG